MLSIKNLAQSDSLALYGSGDNEVTFRPVKFSMDELIDVQETLSSTIGDFSFYALGINEIENKVNVYTPEITDAERVAILGIVPTDSVHFIYGEPVSFCDPLGI